MAFSVVKDGTVGTWHRWVVISTAATVLSTYIAMVILSVIIVAFEFDKAFGFTKPDPLDWRVMLFSIPYGILRGERGYQRDLKANGPEKVSDALLKG